MSCDPGVAKLLLSAMFKNKGGEPLDGDPMYDVSTTAQLILLQFRNQNGSSD